MPNPRLHPRLSRPDVEIDSPLIDCSLVDLSASGLGIETSVGLRLGVPYPFRLRDGKQELSTEAVVRWCRLVRNETENGDARPVYRAGAVFVDWQHPDTIEPLGAFEAQVDAAIDRWIARSRTPESDPGAERTIIQRTVGDSVD